MFATPLPASSDDLMEPLPRLLIVDDDPFIRQLLRDVFAKGYEVICVSGGRAALEVLARHRVDTVLLDIIMPEMKGLEALQQIRRIPENADLPIILISAQSDSPDIVKGLELGANDYLTKPLDLPVIQARVENQVRLKRRLDERKREITLLQNEQDMKDRFIRIASHDLKGPLTNLKMAQFYLRGLVGDNPEALNALNTIETTLDSMGEVVEEFLGTAALQQGRLELNLAEVEIEGLLWEVVTQYSMNAQRKEIALRVSETSGKALADAGLLQQIVGNLVSNAIKYSPFASTVTLSSRVEGERVRVSVADEGPGIPENERNLLFQPFSKLSARPTGGESSTGLGLWIAKQLALVHKGAIGVECPPAGGSIFWLELPNLRDPA